VKTVSSQKEFTSIPVAERLKDDLDEERATGQSWNGLLTDMLEVWREQDG